MWLNSVHLVQRVNSVLSPPVPWPAMSRVISIHFSKIEFFIAVTECYHHVSSEKIVYQTQTHSFVVLVLFSKKVKSLKSKPKLENLQEINILCLNKG